MTGQHQDAGAVSVLDFVLADGGNDESAWLTFEGRTLSRGEVWQAVDAATARLRSAGVGPGSLVAVSLENGLEVVPAILAVWASGAAAAPLNPNLGDIDLAKQLEALRPSCIIVAHERHPDVVGRVPWLTVLDEHAGLLHQGSGGTPASAPPPGVALVLHTSGTSGAPKAVMLPHHALLQALETVLDSLGERGRKATPGSASLVVFSLAHVAGLFSTLLTFRSGRRLVLVRRFTVDGFVEAVAANRIRSVILNPTMIQMILGRQVPADALADLLVIRTATAPLPKPVAEAFWERYRIPILNSYGQTETVGEVIGWTHGDFRAFGELKLGSVGRPHAGVRVKFIDESGGTVTAAEVGELCLEAPFSMSGYLTGPAVDKFTDDGYLRTGDIGYQDDDGFVWLVGRLSDVIICGGFKVMPEEVEDVIRQVPGVADVMVSGIPDVRLGEVPHAFVVAAPGAAFDQLVDAVIERCRDALTHYKAPRAVHQIDVVPRNAGNKVLRSHGESLRKQAITTKEEAR